MAPIFSTAVGVTPQIIDDQRLRDLLDRLNNFELNDIFGLQLPASPEDINVPFDIPALVSALEPYQTWVFEEQVDLHEWIHPLNAIDAALTYLLQKYPSLLLIGPVKRKRGRGTVDAEFQLLSRPAESQRDVAQLPDFVVGYICVLLRFLSSLLRNAASKSVFNSVEELVDLLAAADDTMASLALEALCNLATPPSLHKQQSPEVNQHTTSLHNSKTASHRRLIALARGWGTRGSGLGLHTCVTVDDSEFGQGSLPQQAGELDFAFSAALDKKSDGHMVSAGEKVPVSGADFQLVRIHLSQNEIVEDALQNDSQLSIEESNNLNMNTNDMSISKSDTIEASKKRRRVGPVVGSKARETKSTSELFFQCIEKAGGRQTIPDDRLFSLLADIRLARAFHSNATRIDAVERRLRALITILHAHPNQEIMSGYFQAQPELCVELIDLLRPTVSSANVSAAAARPKDGSGSLLSAVINQDALGALADSPGIPYSVRMLAIEALTALVARRDGTSGALSGSARHSSVLNELGVGKGQYLGLLPTLIRFSLASLGSSFAIIDRQLATTGVANQGVSSVNDDKPTDADDLTLDVGIAFVEATKKPPPPRVVQLCRALEFIDAVLTLTSAIVSTPTGTSALTDCGLIPALLTTAAMDSQTFIDGALSNSSSFSNEEILRVNSLLRFITAQAIQILEGAIVTHNNALSAFHDLHGVEVLTSRLSREVMKTLKNSLPTVAEHQSEPSSPSAMDCEPTESSAAISMQGPKDIDMDTGNTNTNPQQRILSSQRVLLFSIVTCLTVVFHNESTSSSVTVPFGGAQLRKPELNQALVEILDDVNSYGGHLASLIATLLSDVLNSDPHVVHHVHKSGLAKSFMNMILGKKSKNDAGEEVFESILPPVPELIMALPNVISALALTEDGANAVKEVDPFPAVLKLFYHPNYAMPKSRCLLNEMTAIVGTGLDEVMRHVQSLKPLVLAAICDALRNIATLAENLAKQEEQNFGPQEDAGAITSDIENERTCLMQYVLNFGQLLEQILHNEDHCEPFVAAGGLDALLRLFPCVMPTGYQLLAHVSSLSCPSVSTLHHSTTEESLCLAFKCVFAKYDPLKLIQTVSKTVNLHLDLLKDTQAELRQSQSVQTARDHPPHDATNILEGLPREPLHMISIQEHASVLRSFSRYVASISNVQWITSLLGTAIKSACQRAQESPPQLSRSERDWLKELSSTEFEELVGRLSKYHQSAIFEVCRIRTKDGFEKREKARLAHRNNGSKQLRYRLRIVCPEGAVVRDGIEIDSCASVGSMEMGEIVEAFDRCINSSGILRYLTRRGWVSEMTRGHGREPIAEVMSIGLVTNREEVRFRSKASKNKRRVEASIPDLCSLGASILARVQTSYSELFNALSRTVIQGVRSLPAPARTLSFQPGTLGSLVGATMRILSSNIDDGFNQKDVVETVLAARNHLKLDSRKSVAITQHGSAMYLGCMLSHLHACLFEEKRERRMVNVPLLLFLLESDSCSDVKSCDRKLGKRISFFDAVRYVFSQSLNDFEFRAARGKVDGSGDDQPHQRIDRTVAASLPPSISLLRRLMSGPLISSSPAASVLSRIKQSDLAILIGKNDSVTEDESFSSDENLFSPEGFVRRLHFAVSDVVRETWIDPRFVHAPPHIVHPFALLVGDIVVGLEEATKKRSSLDSRSARADSSQWDYFRGAASRRRPDGPVAPPVQETFEPSEETISRLTEMGFSRDHALDALESTQSNRVEIVMEYALSHPPPSPASIERRRVAQQERQRQRDEQRQRSEAEPTDNDGGENGSSAPAVDSSSDNPPPEDNSGGTEAMDVEPKQEQTKRDSDNDDDMGKAKSLLQSWIHESSRVSCSVLAGGCLEESVAVETSVCDEGKGEGDGEKEALTVVLCSFLLDLCQRYPKERTLIVTQLLELLKSMISERSGGFTRVLQGKESSMACLCHAAVLFTRALPKTRCLILRANLVSSLVSCIQGFLKSFSEVKSESFPGDVLKPNTLVWPMWLAPVLLLLDVVAQPVVAFSKKSESDNDTSLSEKNEFLQVQDEHKMLLSELTEVAGKIFSSVQKCGNQPGNKSETKSKHESVENGSVTTKAEMDGQSLPATGDNKNPDEIENAFSSIPAYFPLLPLESVDACLDICLNLLKKGKIVSAGASPPPPGVVQATLLLFLRLLRTPKLSLHCLQMGAAEAILSLPRGCRFTGNSGLVTLILRRLLEDEATLQAVMETEIRGTVAKLHGKRKESLSDNEKPSVSRTAFMQAITPLLCRDPVSFLIALTLSVKIEKAPNESSESNAKITLLSPSERSRNYRALSDFVKPRKHSSSALGTSGRSSSRRRLNASRQRRGSGTNFKSKSPVRSSFKSCKKHKKEKSEEKSPANNQSNGTPANHITTLLISEVMSSSRSNVVDLNLEKIGAPFNSTDAFADDSSFLWTANLLEILADLVLAVPACASSVQRYRPRSSKNVSIDPIPHALLGCHNPPKTFISFLLHSVLPQDRWTIKNDVQLWERPKDDDDENNAVVSKKKTTYRLNKVSQTAARLLVALVARPGEGRRRVIAELTFALSGGRLGHASIPASQLSSRSIKSNVRELHALQAWGELCMGLAAPRSNGKNPEGNSSLSFEVIKLMLEFGMCHALLFAIQFVRLQHPMASSTCSALLLPFEIFSRGSVSDVVRSLANKESTNKDSKLENDPEKVARAEETTENIMDISGELTQQSDIPFSDEVMLEEAFHENQDFVADPSNDAENDDAEGEVDVEMDEDMDDGSDDEMSSSSESDETSDVGSSEDEEENDDDEEDDDDDEDGSEGEDEEEGSVLEESEGISSDEMEEVEEGGWNVNYHRDDMVAENQEFEDAEEDGMEQAEAGLDEGWTRIESSAFGGMLLGGRRGGLSVNSGPLTARTRGFIDAAEAMIGTLLRTGEIHGDALAEIEGSLGIRIMSNGRSLRAFGSEAPDTGLGESIAVRLTNTENRQSSPNSGDVVGTLPHVHQRSQPDLGYSALSGGGRWIEISSMEYVYGGPSVTAGNRNYDLVSPVQAETEGDPYPSLSQLDLHLFPGGPASAAHARTQHSLHPLLCGVDLPPVNSLVSDLLPHGVRATRRGQMTTRRPGDWTNASLSPGSFLVLTSNGNIIRSNRSHTGTPLSLVSSGRNTSGPVGWTDDGLPFDATVEEFSTAFERALGDSMASLHRETSEFNASNGSGGQRREESNVHESDNGRTSEEQQEVATATASASASASAPALASAPVSASASASALPSNHESQQNRLSEAAAEQEDRTQRHATSDGDGVASSLAEGLRLSPRSETSAASDRMSTSNAAEETAAQDQQTSADLYMEEADDMERNGSRTEEMVQSGENSGSLDAVAVEGSQATQGESTLEEASAESIQVDAGATCSNEALLPNGERSNQPNGNGLICPPDIDEEVFNSLPVDMQRDFVEQHRATQELAAQLDAGSSLDPEALAALPEDLRREVIQQEQQERRLREQTPADPSNAEEMDNASFLASLAPDLREEILLTADDTFLNSLPPNIIAEAQILRERAAAQHRRLYDEPAASGSNREDDNAENANSGDAQQRNGPVEGARENADAVGASLRRKHRSGKLRVDRDREQVVYLSPAGPIALTPPVAMSDIKTLLRLMYLLSPIRPARLLQKVFQNLCAKQDLRLVISTVFVKLLLEDDKGAVAALESMEKEYEQSCSWRRLVDELFSESLEFPPLLLLGAVPDVLDTESFSPNITLQRRKQGSSTAASIAANLPTSAGGSRHEQRLPPVVATRIVDTLMHMCKTSPKFCLHTLVSKIENNGSSVADQATCFDKLLDLLDKQRYLKSSANLEQLLTLLEAAVSPLSHLSKHSDERLEVSQRDAETAAAAGKEWIDVPRVIVSPERLQLLCSILRMETCRDAAFTRVNTIVRRLCRVDANRGYVLAELASVAHALGADAVRDLKALRIRMDDAVLTHQEHLLKETIRKDLDTRPKGFVAGGSASSSITLSTSTSELKLLRVLQTLQALCGDSPDEAGGKKNEGSVIVTEELVQLLRAMKLDSLWDELSACLKVVQVLEGVSSFKDDEEKKSNDGDTNDDGSDENGSGAKKLKNSSAGLLTRFLPSIEAFFVANASAKKDGIVEKTGKLSESNQSHSEEKCSGSRSELEGISARNASATSESGLDKLVGGKRLVEFVAANKVLLNALVRNNAGLLDKGLRGLVQVPRCRMFLDFDVKRQWFKTQVRRLRQHASRRHGSLRLHIRRKHVFEDAYHQLRLRNADEMRGRLHITFRNEEGVDAGGLSREFFGILSKEIFNPDYALFTSTEDGCTFQPNPNSSINPDHLSYFRFVGRIVGKAVADGFLLDAHFTRSLYKHMLGLKPTHHDMEAIDPDYYRNLKTILEYNLVDIGLDLTFSTVDHSFGRNQVIDLIPNGRNVAVTEERKAEYVSLVCQHRMTTAISSQIKAYLDGFYELVSTELIAIFTPRELELLISGLPEIDMHDLKQNTDYVGWKATDKQIEWFWNVMFSLSRNEKAAFLQFVTGSSKVPLNGFSELQGMRGVQKFSIHKANGSSGALMSAHTCFNSLDLPVYNSEEELREKLLYAINEGVGAFMFA